MFVNCLFAVSPVFLEWCYNASFVFLYCFFAVCTLLLYCSCNMSILSLYCFYIVPWHGYAVFAWCLCVVCPQIVLGENWTGDKKRPAWPQQPNLYLEPKWLRWLKHCSAVTCDPSSAERYLSHFMIRNSLKFEICRRWHVQVCSQPRLELRWYLPALLVLATWVQGTALHQSMYYVQHTVTTTCYTEILSQSVMFGWKSIGPVA